MNFLFFLFPALFAVTWSASDFSLKGDPCSQSDLCGSKSVPKTCTCDEDCHLYGTCCQDVEGGGAPPDFLCRDSRMTHPVFAKRACSGDFRGHVADKLACYDDDEDEMDVANNLLVTSRRTKIVYWNWHCARCSHEVESDLELWNIDVRCPRRPGIDASLIRRNLTFDPDQKRWGLEAGGEFHPCLVDYSPPSFADQVKRCTPNLLSSCADNYTDQDVASKCSRYYGQRRDGKSGAVYKNIHCAICHGADLQDLECPGMSPEGVPERASGDAAAVHVTFYGGDWLEREPGKEFQCSQGYSYDPARRKCRSYEAAEPPVAASQACTVVPAVATLALLLLAL